jgi:AraC-like DNA-binding protein
MDYREFPPLPGTERFVRCVWTLEGAASEAPAPALPDGCPELVLNFGDPCLVTGGNGRLVRQPPFVLVGQITRPFAVSPTGSLNFIAVRFTPAGASYLHQPMSEITDTWQDIRELPSAAPLKKVVERSMANEARMTLLHSALAHIITQGSPIDERVLSAVEIIERKHGVVPIDTVAKEVAMTTRHLQRLFTQCVGISPKLLSRIRRFQRVFAALRDQPEGWASVAIGCGYADQAHLIRDFTELGGGAPAGLLADLPEFTRQFTPLRR